MSYKRNLVIVQYYLVGGDVKIHLAVCYPVAL